MTYSDEQCEQVLKIGALNELYAVFTSKTGLKKKCNSIKLVYRKKDSPLKP